jgi:hypothetical protein
MPAQTTLHLAPEFFTEKEEILIESAPFTASAFRYPSGVKALRLKNERGYLVMLPFQGQQIWSAEFDGRDLTMRSMFTAPRLTRVYLENYGAFLLHCGATAMGVPTGADTHPLHGELPNAPYEQAYLTLGEDERGSYIALGGRYQHTVAFSYNYLAEPEVRLYAGSALARVTLKVTNLKRTPMELMYLAHINFKPVIDSRLVYSAVCSPETVRVRTSIPSHVHPGPGFVEFLQELQRHPSKHHILSADLMFDPEVVFFIDYLADDSGWAYSLQILPDGSADYVAHRPQQLDKGVRWICRTPDQEALGIILPATAESEGYHVEQAKGNLKVIPAGESWFCEMFVGALTPAETKEMELKIRSILDHNLKTR